MSIIDYVKIRYQTDGRVFDTEYFIEGYSNLKPHWRGLGKSHIYYITKKKVWRLESFYAVEKVTKSSKVSLMI